MTLRRRTCAALARTCTRFQRQHCRRYRIKRRSIQLRVDRMQRKCESSSHTHEWIQLQVMNSDVRWKAKQQNLDDKTHPFYLSLALQCVNLDVGSRLQTLVCKWISEKQWELIKTTHTIVMSCLRLIQAKYVRVIPVTTKNNNSNKNSSQHEPKELWRHSYALTWTNMV